MRLAEIARLEAEKREAERLEAERIRQEIKNDHHYLTITDLTFGDKGKKFSIIISIVRG